MPPVRAKRDLRDGREGDREGRRVRQLLGERKARLGVPSALSVVPSLTAPSTRARKGCSPPGWARGRVRQGRGSTDPRPRGSLPSSRARPASRLSASARTRPGCEEATASSSRTAAFFMSPAYWQCSAAVMRRRLMLVERIRGRQRDRALGEVGRSLSGAARTGVRGRGVQRRRDRFVGAGCRDREMAGALLEIDIQLREALVKTAPPVQRHRLVAGGCREADG